MEYIIIENEEIQIKAKLLADKNPKTCKAIWDELPIDVDLGRWGEELYCSGLPIEIEEENSQLECEIGDIGYWIQGNGIAIFFGRTPASTSDKPKAATAVNIFAKVEGDPSVFKQFTSFKGTIKKGD